MKKQQKSTTENYNTCVNVDLKQAKQQNSLQFC